LIRVATIVKNEEHRYWRSALEAWQTFAEDIIVFDDDSEDDTRKIADEMGCDTFNLIDNTDMWGNETPHRAALFNYAMSKAEVDDVIFWLDADMVPAKDPTKFFDVEGPRSWAFKLYDLWAPSMYRTDEFWRGHLFPRVWAIRKPEDYLASDNVWEGRGIHSGHIPASWWKKESNFTPQMMMPADLSLLHYGYYTPQDRYDRDERYQSVKFHLTPEEIAHAETILDVEPVLRQLPFTPTLTLRHE